MLALRFLFWGEWKSGTVACSQAKQSASCSGTVIGGQELPVFGGAPRPFFSYSHERLAWSEKPLVPKKPPVAAPANSSGYVSNVQFVGTTEAFASLGMLGSVQSEQKRQNAASTVLYVPVPIFGSSASRQEASAMAATAYMVDMELEMIAWLLVA